jgi:hypothetical protein
MTVSAQLADAGVPARMIHKGRFWGMRNTAPATTSSPPDRQARIRLDEQRPGSSSPVPSASPHTALTADLAKVRVTQKQNGKMPWQP